MTVEPTSDPTSKSALSQESILRAFEALSLELGQRGVVGEVCLLDGTVMVLAFTARLTTKDVDALFQPAQPIREIARRIAADQNLPDDWLNDGAKGFLSARHEKATGNLPQFPHLRLTMPVPEYLLAMRPKSLAQVAEQARQGDAFDRCLANFLDEFYARPNAAALAAPPILLAPSHGDLGRVRDAYLAATAEELARAHHLPCPAWTAGDARVLHRPWFASPLAALRAVLLLESPPTFRARNLFVSANALTRA